MRKRRPAAAAKAPAAAKPSTTPAKPSAAAAPVASGSLGVPTRRVSTSRNAAAVAPASGAKEQEPIVLDDENVAPSPAAPDASAAAAAAPEADGGDPIKEEEGEAGYVKKIL